LSDGPSLERLSREELIRLVGELRAAIARHEATIAQQRQAIAALQARAGTGRATDEDGAAAVAARPAAAEARRSSPPAAAPPAEPVARPVPGADFTVVFDGGSLGNPGRGYGSYQIVGGDGLVAHRRLEFGDRVSNNQAEYRTLIDALEDLHARLGRDSAGAAIAVRGDSQLVVNQVIGRWRVKHPDLQPLRERVAALLKGFQRTDVAWQPRAASARVLGH
jgi:ribonuclease HI